jgi:hypothetical protein
MGSPRFISTWRGRKSTSGRARAQGLSRRGRQGGLRVMTVVEVHYALPPRSAVARQLKKVALERRHETLILRNEAKRTDGPGRGPPTSTGSTAGSRTAWRGSDATVEPAAGLDRALLAFLSDAYVEEEVRGEKRVILGFHPELAPVKMAVLSLLKKREEIVKTAHPGRARQAVVRGLGRYRRHRPPLPAPGRGGHAVLCHGGRADRG